MTLSLVALDEIESISLSRILPVFNLSHPLPIVYSIGMPAKAHNTLVSAAQSDCMKKKL